MAQRRTTGVMVKQAAAREHGWPVADVEASVVEALSREGCTFYRASNPTRLDQPPLEYAVLSDGLVTRDAAEVLRRCGRGAPPMWWAQVATRLGRVRGILVDEHAPSAIRKILAAGADWAPRVAAGDQDTSLSFFTVDYEQGVVLRVQARLPTRGDLTVEQVALLPDRRRPSSRG